MAPMLLPFWTDGCIGSMEGLYFEASATTPYHFLNQCALSANCSCAQRDLPYGAGFDIDLGVAAAPADGRPLLPGLHRHGGGGGRRRTPTSPRSTADGVWHVYLVADSDAGRAARQRAGGAHRRRAGQVVGRAGLEWFQDPTRWDVPLADDGPDEWAARRGRTTRAGRGTAPIEPAVRPGRATTCSSRREVPLPTVTVSDIDVGRRPHQLRRVRARRAGARARRRTSRTGRRRAPTGPYRVHAQPHGGRSRPSTHVELHYGRTGVDIGSYAADRLGHRRRRVLLGPAPAPALERWRDGRRSWPRRPRRRLVATRRPPTRSTTTGPAATIRVDRTTDADADDCRRRSLRPRRRDRRPGDAGQAASRRFAVVGSAVTAVDVGLFARCVARRPAPVGARRRRARARRRRLRVVGAAPGGHLPRRPVPALAVRARGLRGVGGRRPARSTSPSPAALLALERSAPTSAPGSPPSCPPSPWPAPCGWALHRRVLFRIVRDDHVRRRRATAGARRRCACRSSSPPTARPSRIGDTVAPGPRRRSPASTAASRSSWSTTARATAPPTAAEAAGADRVVVQPANRGKGAAVRAGMLAAHGPHDRVHRRRPRLRARPAASGLLDEVEAGWDVVVGSRRHDRDDDARAGRPAAASSAAGVINWLTHAVLLGALPRHAVRAQGVPVRRRPVDLRAHAGSTASPSTSRCSSSPSATASRSPRCRSRSRTAAARRCKVVRDALAPGRATCSGSAAGRGRAATRSRATTGRRAS